MQLLYATVRNTNILLWSFNEKNPMMSEMISGRKEGGGLNENMLDGLRLKSLVNRIYPEIRLQCHSYGRDSYATPMAYTRGWDL